MLCSYARLYWQKHDRDSTLDEPAPVALRRAVRALLDALPSDQHRIALLRAVKASLSPARARGDGRMSVTATGQGLNCRNAPRRNVTPQNKCLACDNSVHEHERSPVGIEARGREVLL